MVILPDAFRRTTGSGKFRRSQRRSDATIRQSYQGWEVEIVRRIIGVTVKREQFTAVVHPPDVSAPDTLTGFSSLHAALAAARARVDEHQQQRRADPPHARRRPRRKGG